MSQEIVGPCACGRFKEFPESIPPLTDGLFHLVAGAAAVCEIQSLRTRLAESEASLEEYRMRLAGALTTSEGNNLDVQDDPRSLDYLRRCPTIRSVVRLRAERDDLLGALRALVVAVQAMFDAIDDPDYKSWPGVREDQLRQAALRARAAIAKVGGKESK